MKNIITLINRSFLRTQASVLLATAMQLDVSMADDSLANAGVHDHSRVVKEGRAIVQRIVKDRKGGGVSVALVDRDRVVWSEGFGWASNKNERPLTSDSAMLMGSVSKVFTAIAVMQLVEQGRINLDARFAAYVPEFKIRTHNPEWPHFTIRHMLQHNSGMPSDYNQGSLLEEPVDDRVTGYRELPHKVADLFLVNPPGRVHSYSNLCFSLLGVLVERVSGESFAEYVNAHILDPLGMKHSSFLNDDRIKSRLAMGVQDGKEEGYPYIRDLAAGSLAATSDDMARFMMSLLNNGDRILRAETLREMFRLQNAETVSNNAPAMGLGFGVKLPGRLHSLQVAWHNGGLRSDYALMVIHSTARGSGNGCHGELARFFGPGQACGNDVGKRVSREDWSHPTGTARFSAAKINGR